MKKFSGIFKKEYLNNLSKEEKRKLYISKGIWVDCEHSDSIFPSRAILDEIYTEFYEDTLITIKEEDEPIRRLRGELKITLNKKERDKLIKKKFDKAKKNLHKCELSFAYLCSEKELQDISYKNFEDYFTDFFTQDIIEEYITTEYLSYQYYMSTFPFNDLIKIEESMKVLNYLKSQTNDKISEPSETLPQKKGLTIFQKLILIDKIRGIHVDTWDDLDYKKKGALISHLLGSNIQYARKAVSKMNKNNKNYEEDYKTIELLIANLLV